MAIIEFNQITTDKKFVGGKAYHLATLSKQNFPIPEGIIVTGKLDEGDHQIILNWWQTIGSSPLAIRSSANDEDGSDYSFAGQNSSFLNITNEDQLITAIINCFDSINKTSSKAYRELFITKKDKVTMNVLIQKMVKPLFAGVYFSVDPRNQNDGDIIEYVEGLGEALVSGEVTPFKIIDGNAKDTQHPKWQTSFTSELRKLGQNVKTYMSKEVDIEWAIDENQKLYLLQARPVTAKFNTDDHTEFAKKELIRLKNSFADNTFWDGQTFAEWVGIPSQLSFSIFEQAFSNHFAYGDSLKRLGYQSFKTTNKDEENQTILDQVFGRAYINLNKLKPLFFGPIPYELISTPRPHLKFNWKLIDLNTIIKTPISIAKMIKVGWNLSSKRRVWLKECRKELASFNEKMNRPLDPQIYHNWSEEELLNRFAKEIFVFTKHHLLWPLTLTVLIESTHKSLLAIAENVLGKEDADKKIKKWMIEGLHTTTYDMQNYYDKALMDPKKRPFFIARYGHRGAGELDLKNPRWIELNENHFFSNPKKSSTNPKKEDTNSVSEEIKALQSFKKTIILQEWMLLKEMLELRELWKMQILKPYAEIRFITEELAKRSGLNSDIYYLSNDEIIKFKVSNKNFDPICLDLIYERKEKEKAFKHYSLPSIVSLPQIEKAINGKSTDSKQEEYHGEAISPGLVFGTVKIVNDINTLAIDDLPSDVIIVAESTDPGWTPVFAKAKGLIIARGGVLSHSAIVAREMGIPAVSSIMNCINIFKNGDRVCVDGNTGRVTYE